MVKNNLAVYRQDIRNKKQRCDDEKYIMLIVSTLYTGQLLINCHTCLTTNTIIFENYWSLFAISFSSLESNFLGLGRPTYFVNHDVICLFQLPDSSFLYDDVTSPVSFHLIILTSLLYSFIQDLTLSFFRHPSMVLTRLPGLITGLFVDFFSFLCSHCSF